MVVEILSKAANQRLAAPYSPAAAQHTNTSPKKASTVAIRFTPTPKPNTAKKLSKVAGAAPNRIIDIVRSTGPS